MELKKYMTLEEWYSMTEEEKNKAFMDKMELTEFSKNILNMCYDLIDCGAYISPDTILKYYKKRRDYTYGKGNKG